MGIQCSPVPRKCKSKGSGPDATLCNFANGGYGNKVGCAYIEYDDSDAMCENVHQQKNGGGGIYYEINSFGPQNLAIIASSLLSVTSSGSRRNVRNALITL